MMKLPEFPRICKACMTCLLVCLFLQKMALKRSFFVNAVKFRRQFATSEFSKLDYFDGISGKHETNHSPALTKFDRLSLCVHGMTDTWGISASIQEHIKRFGQEIRFPVLSCGLFKQALTPSSYEGGKSGHLDLRKVGRDVLRILFTRRMYLLLKGYRGTFEAEAAGYRLVGKPNLFHDFAAATKLASYIIPVQDNASLKLETGIANVQQTLPRSISSDEKFSPSENCAADDGIRNVSLAVAGAVYLDTADTDYVEQVFFPHLTNALEEEATLTLAKMNINYEETKPEYFHVKFKIDCLKEELMELGYKVDNI